MPIFIPRSVNIRICDFFLKEQVMPKVLIAEDDPVSRKKLVRSVENSGCMVIQCSNGRRACETLADNPDIDLLITDVIMPDMNGKQLIRVIRGHERFANLPVLIISGVVDAEEVESLLRLGNSHFLSKPVRPKKLTELVAHILKDAKSAKIIPGVK